MRRNLALLLVGLGLTAQAAHADIAVLTSGATLKIRAHRTDGDTVLVELSDGGEVGIERSLLVGVVPDEVIDELAPVKDAADLRALAIAAAERHRLDPQLVLAVVGVESSFRPDARSPKGAQGLMQLMPATAADLGVADSLDPEQNLEGGARYLEWLMAVFSGDLEKVLAGYNAGPGAVTRSGGVPPYRETRDYVARVMKRYKEQR
jgi:hypothetical protein